MGLQHLASRLSLCGRPGGDFVRDVVDVFLQSAGVVDLRELRIPAFDLSTGLLVDRQVFILRRARASRQATSRPAGRGAGEVDDASSETAGEGTSS